MMSLALMLEDILLTANVPHAERCEALAAVLPYVRLPREVAAALRRASAEDLARLDVDDFDELVRIVVRVERINQLNALITSGALPPLEALIAEQTRRKAATVHAADATSSSPATPAQLAAGGRHRSS